MIIQELTPEDLPAAQRLIWETFMTFEAPDYTQEGIDTFRRCLYDAAFLSGLAFYGAFLDGTLIGVLATRGGGSHISMFFVRGDCQHQGIGRQLFHFILKENPPRKMTVHSAPYAVGIYEKLGFKTTDTEQLTDGIRYTPMAYISGNDLPSGNNTL